MKRLTVALATACALYALAWLATNDLAVLLLVLGGSLSLALAIVLPAVRWLRGDQ